MTQAGEILGLLLTSHCYVILPPPSLSSSSSCFSLSSASFSFPSSLFSSSSSFSYQVPLWFSQQTILRCPHYTRVCPGNKMHPRGTRFHISPRCHIWWHLHVYLCVSCTSSLHTAHTSIFWKGHWSVHTQEPQHMVQEWNRGKRLCWASLSHRGGFSGWTKSQCKMRIHMTLCSVSLGMLKILGRFW